MPQLSAEAPSMVRLQDLVRQPEPRNSTEDDSRNQPACAPMSDMEDSNKRSSYQPDNIDVACGLTSVEPSQNAAESSLFPDASGKLPIARKASGKSCIHGLKLTSFNTVVKAVSIAILLFWKDGAWDLRGRSKILSRSETPVMVPSTAFRDGCPSTEVCQLRRLVKLTRCDAACQLVGC